MEAGTAGPVHPGELEDRFAFGENWTRFLETVDEESIATSTRALATMLRTESLEGATFLDVGSGSGLSSLAALRLGAARVHSFDYDPDSVAATTALRARYLPDDPKWTVERGDALDPEYMRSLGTWDVVYSWGVLHHTGDMWRGVENAIGAVAPGGRLFIALYNDQGRRSRMWTGVKRVYNRVPEPLRPAYAAVAGLPLHLKMLRRGVMSSGVRGYVRSWREPRKRGMSKWHDVLDWIGGYPFEVATPERVFEFCRDRGFKLVAMRTCGGDMGCNEFVFEAEAGAGS